MLAALPELHPAIAGATDRMSAPAAKAQAAKKTVRCWRDITSRLTTGVRTSDEVVQCVQGAMMTPNVRDHARRH